MRYGAFNGFNRGGVTPDLRFPRSPSLGGGFHVGMRETPYRVSSSTPTDGLHRPPLQSTSRQVNSGRRNGRPRPPQIPGIAWPFDDHSVGPGPVGVEVRQELPEAEIVLRGGGETPDNRGGCQCSNPLHPCEAPSNAECAVMLILSLVHNVAAHSCRTPDSREHRRLRPARLRSRGDACWNSSAPAQSVIAVLRRLRPFDVRLHYRPQKAATGGGR